MESGHALQAVVRIECAALKAVGGGGLNTQAEVQHRIDLGVGTDQVQDFRHRIPGLAARQINRIIVAPAGRNQGTDRLDQVWGEGE